jgi:hypothetical protein
MLTRCILAQRELSPGVTTSPWGRGDLARAEFERSMASPTFERGETDEIRAAATLGETLGEARADVPRIGQIERAWR